MSTKLVPEIKFNKNGYEIRTEILDMAKDLALNEFHAKFGEWEITVGKDKHGMMLHRVQMPDFPNLDIILQNAEKLYSFVNKGK